MILSHLIDRWLSIAEAIERENDCSNNVVVLFDAEEGMLEVCAISYSKEAGLILSGPQ